MKHQNTLFLEARGCYFWDNDEIKNISNVGNYRVGSYDYSIKGKNGIDYILEFGAYDKRETRTTHKKTGKKLKHPVTEIVLNYGLHIDTQFENSEGCFRDLALEKELHNRLIKYTREGILSTVNYMSVKQYDRVVIVSSSCIVKRIEEIYQFSGYRERYIIDNLFEVKTIQYDKNYLVFEFIAVDGSKFEYEYYSNRITG